MFLQKSVMGRRFQAMPVPASKTAFQVGPYRMEKPSTGAKGRSKRGGAPQGQSRSIEIRERSVVSQVDDSVDEMPQ